MNRFFRRTTALPAMQMRIVRSAYCLLLVSGLFAVGYAGFVYADSRFYQVSEAKKFSQLEKYSDSKTVAEGDLIGEIQVPRLRIRAMVVQGDAPSQLRRAVGHLAKSAMPGEWGNVALAGHRDTFFRPLRGVRVGDEILVITFQSTFKYRVESIEVVAPTDIWVLQSSSARELTLLTCFPFHYVGPAPKRFIVRAQEIGRAEQQSSEIVESVRK